MASKVDQFWELFKAVSGDTSADVTESTNAIAKSDRTKVESYFSNVIDQFTFSTTDYNRLRKFLIDLYATHRTQSSISLASSDPHALTNSDLDELFRSMGYNLSASLRGFDENPLEQKVQFFLDLVNLYKVKGTPQSLVDVLQYYGVTKVDIYEFFLKKDTPSSLVFDGKAVAGTTVNPSDISIPYASLTSSDPHWLYTAQQILTLDSINKINLPSKSPYLGVQPTVELEGAEMAIIERNVQDQYDYYVSHGTLPTANAEITYIGEIRSLLELYLSCVYMFNKLYTVGSTLGNRFLCYDGTNVSDEVAIINAFDSLTNSKVETRAQLKSRYNQYLNLYSRPTSENFLVNASTAGTLLNTIAPDIKSALDSAGEPLEVLYSLLKDLSLWVRANIGFGFVNFGFILFGLQQFFTDLKPVIEFFKPYHARLLLLENLQIRNRLFNTIVIEDQASVNADFEFHDFVTGDGQACCQQDDSTCGGTITACHREFVGGSPPPSFNWRDNWLTATNYSINDAVASGLGNQYICIQAHKSGAATKPGFGSNWTTYWQLMSSMVCSDSTASVSYYARETYDCGSYFDIGAVTDIEQDINIQVEQEFHDHLRCPASDTTGFVVSEILNISNISFYTQPILAGSKVATMVFEEETPDTNYGIGLSVVFDQSSYPSESPETFAYIVRSKTISSFQVELSGQVSDGYYIDWFTVDSTNSSSVQIDTTATSFIVNLPTPCSNTNYSIAGTIVNITDSNPSIYGFTIADKTTTSFRVILSGIIDSPNYTFDYFIYTNGEHGNYPIPAGNTTIDVTYPTPLPNSTYPLMTVIETDDPNIYTWTVVEKSTTGFSVELSGAADSTGYVISWIVPTTTSYNSESIEYYQSGGFRDFDSEGTFDCTHGFDLVQISVEDVYVYLLQETGYYLLQEDGARILL